MGSTAPAAPIPNQARSKNLRACLLCSIVQTPVDFRRNGCPNCEDITQVKKDALEPTHPFLSISTKESPRSSYADFAPLFFSSQMKGSPDRIQACTTTHFDGCISVVDPEKSWVARWQRTSTFFFFEHHHFGHV
jgi:RNA polymerase subunit RPABC4/transcription elongation factor Spt4